MREGKYVDEVYKRVCELPDNDIQPHRHLLLIAETVAKEHPVWYERFRVRAAFVRLWRWATGRTFGATSGKRDDSNEKTDGGGGCGDG